MNFYIAGEIKRTKQIQGKFRIKHLCRGERERNSLFLGWSRSWMLAMFFEKASVEGE